jgi:hypothetical protein
MPAGPGDNVASAVATEGRLAYDHLLLECVASYPDPSAILLSTPSPR